ncbi:dTDP-4-dehydrorhamnose reductase [Patescibacteria group bacterium]
MRNSTQKNKSKVLIIGSLGMLGQELVAVFRNEDDYEVVAWDKKEIDVTKEENTKRKIKKLSPNIIINAAAYNAVDKCEKDSKQYQLAKNLNGKAPGLLASIAKKIGATFVHYSTDYVFDGSPEIPEPAGCSGACGGCDMHKDFKAEIGFAEDAEPNPISNYGKSKLAGEKAVAKSGDKYYIIRLSKLFGKAASSKKAKNSFFDVMLSLGKNPPAGGKEVRVVDEEISCFTYAPDLARKTKEILEARKPFGIYHISNGEPCTWYEATLELYKQLGKKTKVIPISSDEFPRPARRPYISTLINTKINPLRSYKEALKEHIKSMDM